MKVWPTKAIRGTHACAHQTEEDKYLPRSLQASMIDEGGEQLITLPVITIHSPERRGEEKRRIIFLALPSALRPMDPSGGKNRPIAKARSR